MSAIDTTGRIVQRSVELVGKTAVGLGAGVCLGIGALSAAAIAEIAIPAILTIKALGLTGSAAGFLWGAKAFKKQ
ncbi:MAG: hypothetical protein WCP29_02135 [Acidobacteriota bacterium]